MEDDEYKKLPIEDRCVHKLWKARVNGYEEVTKLFRQIDEKSPEFQKYLGLVKKFVVDSNAVGQEKGLEATLAFVENYALAGKTVGEVMAGIVAKCMAAPKAKTRDLALQVTLMYIEIEKHEIVQEELIKGMDLKNPKIVAACITACTTALHEFGSKVITVKPLLKKIAALFSDRDKGVRDEAKLMVIEMYSWIGPALRSQLTTLQPLQITELETEFAKIEGHKATPTRYLRSQQEKQAKLAVEATDAEEEEEEEEDGAPAAIDVYDLAEPVDILSKLPKDFYDKIEEKKWQERKEALEAVENLLKAPRLESGDYGDLVRALKKVVQKDSNVLCTALAAKSLAGLASGLKKRFQPYASACVSPLLEKFKEKKQNVVLAVRDAIDAVYLATTLENILDDLLEAFSNKNPSVKSETSLFLARAFTKTQPAVLNKKLLKALTGAFIKIINEPDPTVRDSSAEAIGTLMKLVGEKAIMPFLVELEKDNLKMTKIRECCEKAVITVKVTGPKKERPTTAPVKAGPKVVKPQKAASTTSAPKVAKRPASGIAKSASNNSLDDELENGAGGDTTPVQDTATRIDISGQITESLINELSDKNWKVRNEGLIKVSNIVTEAKLIKSNIGDLPQALALRLVDSNSKIAQTALNICEIIANAMGSPCKQYVRVLFPGCLQCLGDGKAWVRSASISCINSFGDQGSYKEFFESEMIGDALKTGSPTLRIELWNWLAEKLPKLKSISKEELQYCIPFLYTNVEDRNADVRKNAQEAVLGFMIHLGYESMVKQTEKLKPGSKAAVIACLDKARPNLPIKPLPSRKETSADAREDKVVRGTKPIANSKNAVKKTGNTKAAPVSRKKEEEIDTSPLLVINNLKHQRTIDESKLRVLKWNFTQPREEFVELLKEQMGAANVNKTLMTNMFHADFRYHIKAIESLMDDLSDNGPALLSNLDLILKWLTIRFFDTNPSVLLKGLEYLHCAFNMLIENKYHMLENEASSFIPYLILKIGDPKDAVRNGVRSLFNKICLVYSVSKLFSYIMDGLKSKNARQRAECLDVMGLIIEDHGISVCLPSPGACLKEVAKQISDRDNAVRNAALNCVVQAYYLVGEKVYKMVGQISDKDMSLLEERIKRALKKPPAPKVSRLEPTVSVVNASPSPREESAGAVNNRSVLCNDDEEEDPEEEMNNLPDVVLPPQVAETKPDEVTGPFMLDPELMKELDSVTYNVPKPNLLTFDLDFLNEEIVVPSIADAKAKVMPMSPPKPILPNQTFSRSSLSAQRQASPRSGQEIILEKTITQIGSQDMNSALMAIEQMQDILQSNKGNLMIDYEDQFMMAIIKQLKLLAPHDPKTNASVLKLYRMLLTLVDADIMNQFIILLVEPKLDACPNGEAFIRVINVHCVKIIERSDHTNIICALVNLLKDCISKNSSTRQTELVMKCLWKIIKLLPAWADEIDYDSILLEVHLFLKEFPSPWWKNKIQDTPLRTIKTVLHSMAKIKSGTLMLHLGKIPNTNDSEMEAYILRLLKTLKLDEVKQVPLKTDTTRSLTRTTHTQLTEIFQKIGNKEETKDGLNLLYDFIQQHPEADIDPFLKKSSPFFQDYIQKHLKEIEVSRKNASAAKLEFRDIKTENVVSSENNSEDLNKGPEFYKDRLKMLNKLWDDKVKTFYE